MNQLLDITGYFLNIILRIVLFPLFVALDCLLASWVAMRSIKSFSKRILLRIKQRPAIYQPALKKSLDSLRTRFIGVHANSH